MRPIFIAFLIVTLCSCSESVPDCISMRIEDFKEAQAECPNARIAKYLFDDKVLYGFSDGQCIADGGTSLLDEACNVFCFIGGIAALTDCDGKPFEANAELVEVIWNNAN